jgi:hypothetical protein
VLQAIKLSSLWRRKFGDFIRNAVLNGIFRGKAKIIVVKIGTSVDVPSSVGRSGGQTVDKPLRTRFIDGARENPINFRWNLSRRDHREPGKL